jgi:DNA processing protein
MTELETAALVALLTLGRDRWPHYSELVEQHASALAVLERELVQSRLGQTRLPFAEDRDELIQRAAVDIAAWETAGMTPVTVLDAVYPANLRTVHDRPPLLFIAGRIKSADSRSIAVVGSRHPTPGGRECARAIAEHLGDAGYTVISGLAVGIDTEAHAAALGRDRRTVAVIGTGLTRCYPPENEALQRTIGARGAVVSQFWPEVGPDRENFRKRNAVMSGLSLGTVVVEASAQSGARLQARLALSHGRPVFLARPLLRQEWAKDLAQRPGTCVFRTPSEITDAVQRLISPGALVA